MILQLNLITSYRHMPRSTNARTALPDHVTHAQLTSSECSLKSDSSSSGSVSLPGFKP